MAAIFTTAADIRLVTHAHEPIELSAQKLNQIRSNKSRIENIFDDSTNLQFRDDSDLVNLF